MIVNVEEPQMARFLKSKVMIKDYHYYKKQDNSWNNPAQTDPKVYKQFHQQQDAGKPIIQEKLKQEAQDNLKKEHIHLQNILEKRDEDFDRYTSRLEERALVQNKSKQRYKSVGVDETQDLDEEFSQVLAKKQNSSRYIRQNENSWNKLNNLSKKYIKQYLTPSVVKGEEQMIEFVQKVLEQENQQIIREKKKIEEMRQNIRETLNQKREHNTTVLRQIGIKFEKPEPHVNTPKNKAWDFLSNIEHESEQKPLEYDQQSQSNKSYDVNDNKSAVSSAKNNSSFFKFGSERTSIGPDIDRLSIPKQHPLKSFASAQTDLKGSLVKSLEKGAHNPGNDFSHELAIQSKLLREIAGNDEKTLHRSMHNKSTPRLITHKIAHKPFHSSIDPIEDFKRALNVKDNHKFFDKEMNDPPGIGQRLSARHNVLNEIDTFEKKFCQELKPVSYPRAKLDNIYKSANLPVPYYMVKSKDGSRVDLSHRDE